MLVGLEAWLHLWFLSVVHGPNCDFDFHVGS